MRHGFTLVELLVVIAIIGMLVALLLPAVQAAREAARRVQCQNNLKQIGLGLQNYHQAYETFPPGGLFGGKNSWGNSYGFSWWPRILPYMEQQAVYDQLDWTGAFDPYKSGCIGWTGANTRNRDVLRDWSLPSGFCPSSPLTPIVGGDKNFSPTYAGVSGSISHATARAKCCTTYAAGTVSFGGVLATGMFISAAHIRDGTSNTLLVAETSDWCTDASGTRFDCRSDCASGLQMGPSTPTGSNNGWDRMFNMTTVRFSINDKQGKSPSVGVGGNCGPNTPIQSAHSGGANAVRADGAVSFLAESLDLQILFNLADRNDGQTSLGL